MGFDRFFGFNTTQKKTLQDLLAQGGQVQPVANVTNVTTPDGSDAGTTQTLANANKAKINQILAALRSAGLLDT